MTRPIITLCIAYNTAMVMLGIDYTFQPIKDPVTGLFLLIPIVFASLVFPGAVIRTW